MEEDRKNDWLISQSLERSLSIISAINRVSIFLKLRSVGIRESVISEQVDAARKLLIQFLIALSAVVERAAESEDKIAFGADPRLSTLARKFLELSAQGVGVVPFSAEELKEMKVLLEKGEAADDNVLAKELGHLRSVLELHSQADAAIVFNEV
jgi:hypothetical protein